MEAACLVLLLASVLTVIAQSTPYHSVESREASLTGEYTCAQDDVQAQWATNAAGAKVLLCMLHSSHASVEIKSNLNGIITRLL